MTQAARRTQARVLCIRWCARGAEESGCFRGRLGKAESRRTSAWPAVFCARFVQ